MTSCYALVVVVVQFSLEEGYFCITPQKGIFQYISVEYAKAKRLVDFVILSHLYSRGIFEIYHPGEICKNTQCGFICAFFGVSPSFSCTKVVPRLNDIFNLNHALQVRDDRQRFRSVQPRARPPV